MANLVAAVNMKRKDAEVVSHGFSILLDPKRAKLQDAEVSIMMEEEEPLAADAPAAIVQPTMFMPSPVSTQGQDADSDFTVGASGSKHSEQTFSADQAEPMDVEVDLQQCPVMKQQQQQQQPPEQHPFFSGFF